ncbi:CotY/CotZ family spore coat protein [Halobacillus sp. ACCC02827]|uniref:CotY/CotZ family spore coat protein n=1 Tax=Bacillaceae TaxID=186817 RepID=UPI0002A4F420|nr:MULTISPECIES: CotY/CotZ family spore coat protein [Bacillaceae]ELK48947.1 spore coat protein [Halobacillus sp. BAB-2008]QHT45727.1 spore coat protein [Bacillus sp. SB49]WJE16526.1 CotY/CotZ family spore coat protein [Halobacillus sp. ACCC02827]
MSSCHSSGKDSGCVRDVIKKIIAAQEEVAGRDRCCDVSCERSIRDLLSPESNGNGPTTVPFILYCKDCKPFIGSSVVRRRLPGGGGTYLDCVQSPIFKAKKFVDGKKNCVKLELLLPADASGNPLDLGGDTVCDYFPTTSVRNLLATGVCITVDLDCVCSITCLEATTPLFED